MATDYRQKAIDCVKGTVLPAMRAQFEECGQTLDEQYARYGDTECFSAEVVVPGHAYEMGYPRCSCPEVASGQAVGPSHCECSRQSILYVLQDLLPGAHIEVETLRTVLGGAEDCRFKVTIE